jgi:hypothetical protein
VGQRADDYLRLGGLPLPALPGDTLRAAWSLPMASLGDCRAVEPVGQAFHAGTRRYGRSRTWPSLLRATASRN